MARREAKFRVARDEKMFKPLVMWFPPYRCRRRATMKKRIFIKRLHTAMFFPGAFLIQFL